MLSSFQILTNSHYRSYKDFLLESDSGFFNYFYYVFVILFVILIFVRLIVIEYEYACCLYSRHI